MIDAVLVLAPKGVDRNWLNDEIPTHIPDGVKWDGALWRANPRKKQRIALGRLADRPIDFAFDSKKEKKMRWLCMNWNAIATQKGFQFAMEFLEKNRCIVIADEAQRVKSHDSLRSKALIKMKPYTSFRRIATGTPVTNTPFDMWIPFTFLSARIFGTGSFVAFKAQYAQMIGKSSPLYNYFFEQQKKRLIAKGMDEEKAAKMAANRVPSIQEKDEDDRPIYKNLDKLQDAVQPYSFRVLKSECLDLPEKVYKKIYFELTDEQEKIYIEARDKLRVVLSDETIQPITALTAIQKLAQIASGFYIETAEGITHKIPGENPKRGALEDLLEDIEGQTIIWANFKAEFADIKEACQSSKKTFVEYHGGINERDKNEAIARFQGGQSDVFIGNPKSGGTGLTLHAASNEIYYSNSYSLEARIQSEDRAHRIGQRNIVNIYDLVAEDTIEEKIIAALQAKSDLAALINGDLLR